MFFRFVGAVVRRGWFVVLAAWGLLLLGVWWWAPSWDEVAQDREFTFLPANSPSRQAEEVYQRAFPDDRLSSTVVLVVHQTDDGPGRLRRDNADMQHWVERVLEADLRQRLGVARGAEDQPQAAAPEGGGLFGPGGEPLPAAPPPKQQHRSLVTRIMTPYALDGPLLVSPDHRALLLVIRLDSEFLSRDNWPVIDKVEGLVGELRSQGKMPPGVDVAVTGSAVLGRDHTRAELRSAQIAERLTIVLVVVLLLLIYRAPLLTLIPLLTVYVAIRVALGVTALLGAGGYLAPFQGMQIYITILAYGAGVDYCLFLMARYKEELDRGRASAEATEHSVGAVGGALTASAGTVICGLGMMYFARFGKFSEAGLTMPLALGLVLLAALTLAPALLRLAGRHAFWPYHRIKFTGDDLDGHPCPGGWRCLLRPGGLHRAWVKTGHLLLRRPAALWLATVAVMAPFAVFAGLNYHRLSYDVIGNLPDSAPSVAGARVLERHFPAGVIGPVTVVLVDRGGDFSQEEGFAVVRRVTDRLAAERDDLGLADVRSEAAPLGVTPQGRRAVAALQSQGDKEDARRAAVKHYDGTLGENGERKNTTRMDLVLAQSPFAHDSITDLNSIEQALRDALPAAVRDRTQVYVVGPTASVRDLSLVIDADRRRIEVLVLISVFVVLVLLLRRLLTPVYLLLSVLFSYFVTMGVTFAVFWALNPHGFTGIDWKVSIFLFAILIAVGEDYNIFLMARVHEETETHGRLRGVTEALARTGPIISSCGLIMAGTFGSLLGGTLLEMRQLGFALAFGVLLDTFVVRPILVPAFLILVRSGRLPAPRWERTAMTVRERTSQTAGS